jgi:hypothetical protein
MVRALSPMSAVRFTLMSRSDGRRSVSLDQTPTDQEWLLLADSFEIVLSQRRLEF